MCLGTDPLLLVKKNAKIFGTVFNKFQVTMYIVPVKGQEVMTMKIVTFIGD